MVQRIEEKGKRKRWKKKKGVCKVPRASTMGEFIPKATRASGKPEPHLECTLRFETKPSGTSFKFREIG